jgi:hypothetical protein
MVTEDNTGHTANTHGPIDVTPLPITTEARESQYTNAPIPITPFGIVTDVKPEQYMNAPPSINVTLPGMTTDVTPEQFTNEPPPILVTPTGMLTTPVIPPGHCHSLVISLEYNTPATPAYFTFPSSTTISVNDEQEASA